MNQFKLMKAETGKRRFKGLAVAFFAILAATGLPLVASAQGMAGQAFEAAESLFRQDQRWLGTDGASSTPLGNNRVFWSFDDTFIAATEAGVRRQSLMVRNSVAIQTGSDPLDSVMSFHWRHDAQGRPASFFPEEGGSWYWPQAAIRLTEGPLVVFLYSTIKAPGRGLGFDTAGYAVAVIENPDEAPGLWNMEITRAAPKSSHAFPAASLVLEGEHVVALALKTDHTLAGALVRFSGSALAKGEIEDPEWWAGAAAGWVRESELWPRAPEFVIDHAGSESSIHWDARIGAFIHITTYGFGAATIGMRTAPALTGPWSAPVMVYRPPESDGPNPFVYGAMAHPELTGPGPNDLVVTYATNSFEVADLFTDSGSRDIYWPRVIAVDVLRHTVAGLPD